MRNANTMRQAMGFYLHTIQEVKQRNVESDGKATKDYTQFPPTAIKAGNVDPIHPPTAIKAGNVDPIHPPTAIKAGNLLRAATKFRPHELLSRLKRIEEFGHTDGIRYGTRPIIETFYSMVDLKSNLIFLQYLKRIWEQPFVMAPLIDLLGSTIDSDTVARWHSFQAILVDSDKQSWFILFVRD
ncbi:hypothetical protein MTR_0076s0050 [Medicago truncatula]|uniref:Uncharacterized protein n=1 Tax=Medicago truncatula TaxID=3880 RepID=A0A072TTN2_MEDTR|nr:hypothetical protein MTR_0076s0050 [Medicago truncatula]